MREGFWWATTGQSLQERWRILCWQACRIDQGFRFILLSFLSNVAQTWHHLDSSKDPTPDLMLYPLAGQVVWPDNGRCNSRTGRGTVT